MKRLPPTVHHLHHVLVLIILAAMLTLAPGCAETKIRTPDGFEYMGQKNVKIDEIEVEKFYPDGKPMMRFKAKGVTSDPTAVNEGTVRAITGPVEKALNKVPDAVAVPR